MKCFSYNTGCDIGIVASPAGLIEQFTKMNITIMIKTNTFRRYLVILIVCLMATGFMAIFFKGGCDQKS